LYARNVGSTAEYDTFVILDYLVSPPLTSATLTPDLPAPQLPGTVVRFLGKGLDGSGSYEYRFVLRDLSGTWTETKPWGTNLWYWDTTGLPTGLYRVALYARNIGSTAEYDTFVILDYLVSPLLTSATLTPDLSAPQLSGAVVRFLGKGLDGSGSYEYRFVLRDLSGTWTETKPWGTNLWYWDTTGLPTGLYRVALYARNLGSTAEYDTSVILDYELIIE
jgi:hypothetical protein